MLNYNVRGENIEVTPAIREYVEKKIDKLERYFNDTPDANVHVNLKVYNDKQTKVEVTIPMPRLTLRAEERHEEMYAAIDLILDKLERQIRKHKTKVNRKFREKGNEPEFFATSVDAENGIEELEPVAIGADDDGDDSEFDIVRTKTFNLKPMDSEEAVLQMNMLGHSFYVFTDAESNGTNIVYKRKDGKYGLIETEA
ncbi:ribosome hibernation-promoting factor, HPF/YfiA family [Jeotgalibacillus sp. R-1-5s-1]|uniref:ribosome hibernation-promoting factor, HPF/YfiA family n=1 Tax=Jeotgalibacillus sp. R-1-5s-1 TaxID=2555897 RepID=UPI00106A2551|nr:ribosome-associated translation inhibitor RaiA [Jeotgalibacillus sp. R-1-5s-1]TFD95809.1 ribosome-associated translation inhibitor RaiA [Jeotgalibacillus sp. R-1-5s-1]